MLLAFLRGSVCALALGGCYLHENGMQTPTPTLHGRPAVAYVIPLPPIAGLPPMLYIPADREEKEPPQGPTQPTQPRPRVRAIDETAATAALGVVDLGSCKEGGAARGYGHARVTFEPNGHVSDVFVDEPLFWTKSVVACVQERLSTVRVQAFDGDAKPVGAWLLAEMR